MKGFDRLVPLLCLILLNYEANSSSRREERSTLKQIESNDNDTIIIQVMEDNELDWDEEIEDHGPNHRSKRQLGFPFGGGFGGFGNQFGNQFGQFGQFGHFGSGLQSPAFQPFQQQPNHFQQQQHQQISQNFVRYPQQGINGIGGGFGSGFPPFQGFPGLGVGGFPQLPSLINPGAPVRQPSVTVKPPTTTTQSPKGGSGKACRNPYTYKEGTCLTRSQCSLQNPGSYNSDFEGSNGVEFYQFQSQQCNQFSTYYSLFGRQFGLGGNLICCPKKAATTTTTTQKPFWSTTKSPWTMISTSKKPNRITNRPPFVITGRPPVQTGPRPTPPTPISSSCGKPEIIGGHDARHFPWIVGLIHERKNRLYCGGSLIDSQHVLTAAHCVKSRSTNYPLNEIRVTIGDYDITRIGEVKHHVRRISKAFVHAGFDDYRFTDDIAILRLSQPVDAKPVCLFTGEGGKRYDDGNTHATVVGWGQTVWQGANVPSPTATTLKEVSIRVMTNAECSRVYQQQNSVVQIQEKMVCAGSAGKDSCRGDSGGPLMITDGGIWRQIGLVSFGIDCGKGPGVYTRIDRYSDWLSRNLKRT